MEDEPEGVDVRAVVDAFAPRLLGRHVRDGADHVAEPGGRGLALHGVRDTEVHDEGVFTRDHHVGRLEITVDHAHLVGGAKAVGHLPCDRDGLGEGKASVLGQKPREVVSLDVGHGEVLDAVDVAEVVDADHVGVSDLPGEKELALEAPFQVFGYGRVLVGLGPDHLEGHGHPELGVPGLINGAHAPRAQQADDVVARTEGFSDHEQAGAAAARRPRTGSPAARRWGRGAGQSGRVLYRDFSGRIRRAGVRNSGRDGLGGKRGPAFRAELSATGVGMPASRAFFKHL